MKRYILSTFVLTFFTACTAFADRDLSRDEILQLFGQLTSQPRQTWIPAGTIEAARSEYKAPKITNENELIARIGQRITEYANNTNKRELTEELQTLAAGAIPFNVRYELANEFTMDSQVIVKYDGNKFYWEINVTSRNDSIRPEISLRANYMTDQFNLLGNARRIFVWDGGKYTAYCLPINQATVDTTSTSHTVNGPLTAGVIPWGYGAYSYAGLAAADTSAVETTVDNQTQIQLTINKAGGAEIVLSLDPAKDYAVTSCITTRQDGSVSLQQYSNYSQVGANWVPGTILLEKYEANTGRLLSRDRWDITDINAEVPPVDAFKIDFKPAARVEYTNLNKPALCRANQTAPAATGNCATAALKYVAAKFGKNLSDKELASLVSKSANQTSLLAMKKFVNNTGLYCTAVDADIKALKNLKNCRVILHLPDKNHFAVLDEIGDGVRVLDPISGKIYGVTDLSKCAAILISDKPFEKQLACGETSLASGRSHGPIGGFAAIPDARLQTIAGALGFTCTKVIQTAGEQPCTPPVGTVCPGSYIWYFERYGCQLASSGSCSSTYLPRSKSCYCAYDNEYEMCVWSEEWTYTYMRACQ